MRLTIICEIQRRLNQRPLRTGLDGYRYSILYLYILIYEIGVFGGTYCGRNSSNVVCSEFSDIVFVSFNCRSTQIVLYLSNCTKQTDQNTFKIQF